MFETFWKKSRSDGMIDVSLSFIRYFVIVPVSQWSISVSVIPKRKDIKCVKQELKKILNSIARKPTSFSLVVLEYFAFTIATFLLYALFLSYNLYYTNTSYMYNIQ